MVKRIFPKIKKKIKGFLTDESGKISKKDALGLAVWGIILSSIDNTFAATSHMNKITIDTVKWNNNTAPVANRYNIPSCWSAWHGNSWSDFWWNCWDMTVNYIDGTSTCDVNHSSWTVNWHYSWTPIGNIASSPWWVTSIIGHGSHGSHGQR